MVSVYIEHPYLLILEQAFLCCEPPFENQLWYWHCETVTVSVCSQCCSSDKRYSEWRPAEDAGGDFTARLRLFREPAQQVSATDCAFVHKRNTNICMVYLDINGRQFLDLLHRRSITSLGVICVVFSLQYCWARKTEDDRAEGSHSWRGSGGSGKRFWNERLGVQQRPAFVSEYQQRDTHHSQLRG